MKNVLILGANGFIGQHLTNRLLGQKDLSVVGYGLHAPRGTEHERFRFVCGDYREETRFADILTRYQIDLIFHLISTTVPIGGTDHAVEELQSNVAPTIRILQAMAKTDTKKLIFASSGGTVYGESDQDYRLDQPLRPICSYGAQKACIEAYLHVFRHTHGLDCKIARMANPYGPVSWGDRRQGIIPILIRRLMEDLPVTLFGDAVRDYIYIDDVVDALVKAQRYSGGQAVFNIGTGVATHLSTVVAMVEHVCGRRFSKITLDQERVCDVHRSVLDISETVRALDWQPCVSLEEGVLRTYREIYCHK